MSKDPAVLFYSQDFLVGTMAMPFEDRGKYITLLCYQHQSGRMSEETIRLLVGSFSDMLRLKFTQDENGLFFNERMEEEIEKRNKFTESRINNGKLGGRPKKGNNLHKTDRLSVAKATQNLIENENVNEDEVYSFDNFWNDYSKKEDKKKCLKLWSKIKSEDKLKIKEHVPKYVLSTPDVQYRKNPFKYLDGECWNNEIKFRSGFKQDLFSERPSPNHHMLDGKWVLVNEITIDDETVLHN